jgi:hypothetical protein
VELTFALKHENADALERKLADVSDPQHLDYGSYLTQDEVDIASN